MRIEATRFGVRTNKTIRKSGNNSAALQKLQHDVVKKSNASGPQIELVNGKLLKSANNFEKKNKNERKRKLKQDQSEEEYSEDYDYDSSKEQEFNVRIVADTKKKATNDDYQSDEETKETYSQVSDDELEQELESLNDEENVEIRELLSSLAVLQRKYKDVDFDDIPENDQYLIKVTQRKINEYKPMFQKVEGNQNKQYRAFTLIKLSGFMDAQAFSRKYLQTGEKQGKYILKSDKHSNAQREGLRQKEKAEKRQNLKKQIKSDMVDY